MDENPYKAPEATSNEGASPWRRWAIEAMIVVVLASIVAAIIIPRLPPPRGNPHAFPPRD